MKSDWLTKPIENKGEIFHSAVMHAAAGRRHIFTRRHADTSQVGAALKS